jgi:hypothetical protein
VARSKTPRVSANPHKGGGKQPASSEVVSSGLRVPRAVEELAPKENDRKVRFRFDLIDDDGEWTLSSISNADHAQLLKTMAHVETMTAGEFFKPGQRLCKVYTDMSACPNSDATDRLESKFQGLDHMVRLEIDGLKRLYGVRTGHEFHIIWWDPEHKVWPSKLRNT